MPTEVRFEYVLAATHEVGEDGYLIYANQQLVALLVQADTGWFLQLGLGLCAREGMIFGRLCDAEAWVRTCIPGFSGPVDPALP